MELQKIWVALAMKADEYTKGLDQALKQADGFAKGITAKLGGAFDNAKKMATLAVAGIGGAVAGGLLAVGGAAFDVSQQTQQAANDMQAQFGMTAEEAERTAKLARSVWADNWGESVEDVSNSMGIVIQQLGKLGVTSDEQVGAATADALALRDAFGLEVPESIDAVNTLMTNFGLTSDQAFDFLASGFQRGLDRSGDFLDTIGEYSTQFANGGASADEFFSLMESGLQGGMLGTDRAADAFKEFRVRIQDGSTLTAESLEMIGISADDLAAKMATGQMTAADAFQLVIDKLGAVDDANLQMQAGVGLLGTQFEDLGTDAALGLSLAGTSLGDLAGATDSINAKYQNFGSLWEGVKRTVIEAVTPITDKLLEWGNTLLPKVQEAAGWVAEKFRLISEALTIFFGTITTGGAPISAMTALVWRLLTALGVSEETAEKLTEGFYNIATAVQSFIARAQTALQPIIEFTKRFVSWKDVLIVLAGVILATVIPAIVSLAISLAPIVLAIGAAIAIVALLRHAWESNFLGIQDKTRAVIDFVRDKVEKGIAFVRDFWSEHGEAILAKAQEVWNGIRAAVQTAIDIITSISDAFRAAFSGDWSKFGEKLREAWDQVWVLITGAVEKFKTWFTSIDWIQLGKDVLTGLGNGLESLNEWLGEKMTAVGQALVDAFKGFFGIESPSTLMLDFGKNIVQGLIDGILELGGQIWDKTKEVFSGFWSKAKDFFGIESPSTLMNEAGSNVGQGFIEGILGKGDSFWEDTKVAFENYYADLTKWWEGRKWKELPEYSIEEFRKGFANFWPKLKPPFDAMYITIRQNWNSYNWADLGRAIVDGIIAGIDANEGRLIARMRALAQAAEGAANDELGVASPSRVFFYIGEMIAQGLIDGIRSMTTPLTEETLRQAKIITNYFTEVIREGDHINGWLGSLPEQWKSRIIELAKQIEAGADSLKAYFQTVIETGDYMNDYLNDLPDDVRPGVQELGEMMARLADQMAVSLEKLRGILEMGQAFSNLGSGFAGIFTQRRLDPMTSRIESINNELGGLYDTMQSLSTGEFKLPEGFDELTSQEKLAAVHGLIDQLERLPALSANQQTALSLLRGMDTELSSLASYSDRFEELGGSAERMFRNLEYYAFREGRSDVLQLLQSRAGKSIEEQREILQQANALMTTATTYSPFFKEQSRDLSKTLHDMMALQGGIDDRTAALQRLTDSLADLKATGLVQLPEGFDELTSLQQLRVVQDKLSWFQRQRQLATLTPEQNQAMQMLERTEFLLKERNRLEEEYRLEQERILKLQEAQQQLQFLQQQFELLKLIKDNDLGADILQGLHLGLMADPAGLTDAMIRALQQMIAAAQRELGIHSPSKVFFNIGRNIMKGLARGMDNARLIEESLSNSLRRGFRPAVSYGVQLVGAGNDRGTTVRINGGYNVYVTGLQEDPLENIEIQRRGAK